MWLATNFGFFSVVQKQGDRDLTVRARARQDIEALRAYCPELGPTISTPLRDYGCRAVVPHKAWAMTMAKIGEAIDYSNFKDSVAEQQGYERASIYTTVWAALYDLVALDKPRRKAHRRPRHK